MMNTPEIKRRLLEKAEATLKANLVLTESGSMLAAGGNQFKSLWVRDFCHSVPGLLAAGHNEVVRNQLETIFKFRNEEEVLPRGLDVVDPKLRVFLNLIIRGGFKWMGYEDKKLKPEYLGEHKTPAYDSNLLFILAAEAYEAVSGAEKLNFSKEQLKALLRPYKFGEDGCLYQPAYSDWQDSTKREGPVLLTHLLFQKAARFLELDSAEQTAQLIQRKFYDAKRGLFRERLDSEQISLDSHFFILKNRLLPEGQLAMLYRNLKLHPIWTLGPVPGVPVFPAYPSTEISWSVRVVGLRHYHDSFIWGWLAAEAYECAKLQGDEFESEWILNCFFQSVRRDTFLAEIYSQLNKTALKPVRTLLYRSESPFSWTAAKWIEALA